MSEEILEIAEWYSPPGDAIRECLKEEEKTLKDLAKALDLSVYKVDKLLDGEIAIDENLAEKLAHLFGGRTKSFWLNRQYLYEKCLEAYEDGRENGYRSTET
jgi:plasmid maintenance system antidote protein VapI